MNLNIKLLRHDIKNIFKDKRTIIAVSFLTLITLIMSCAFCFVLQNDNSSLANQYKAVSNIESLNTLSSFFIYIYSFLIFSTYPFILGIVIVSYLKEFGTLELMMLFPINRKQFFIEKTLCIFLISLVFCWISILLNSCIQPAILSNAITLNSYKLIYSIIVLPVWLFFLSLLTIIISSLSKDSKEANQKSLIIPFIMIAAVQLIFILKINIFSYKIIFLPLTAGLIGIVSLSVFIKKKMNIERILYS